MIFFGWALITIGVVDFARMLNNSFGDPVSSTQGTLASIDVLGYVNVIPSPVGYVVPLAVIGTGYWMVKK